MLVKMQMFKHENFTKVQTLFFLHVIYKTEKKIIDALKFKYQNVHSSLM